MKILYFTLIILLITNNSCQTLNQKNNITMNTIDIRIFEKNKKNEEYKYIKNDTVNYIVSLKDSYYLSKNTLNNPNLKTEFFYDKNTKKLTKEQQTLFNIPVGNCYEYNEDGDIIKTVNYDKDFTFDSKKLIEKLIDLNVDLSKENKKTLFHRMSDGKNKPFYLLYIPIEDSIGSQRMLKIDGITGQVLADKIGRFTVE